MSNEPITVSNHITIDHWRLGHSFWNWNNEEQAQFLHGLYHGMCDVCSGTYGLQLMAVLEHAKEKGIEMDLAELVETLQSYLTPDAAA